VITFRINSSLLRGTVSKSQEIIYTLTLI